MLDHDQRFKTLIRTFFGDFLALFFTAWAERLDVAAVEWLDKEVFPDPPQGQRHTLDLVGRLPTRQVVAGQFAGEPEHWLALVHIEIESPDKATPLRPRMFRSYVHLRDQHILPVLPLDEEQEREFERLVATEPYKGVQPMETTIASRWYEKGREQERREILRKMLEARFGPLSTAVQERLQQVPVERLSPLLEAGFQAQSLQELGLED